MVKLCHNPPEKPFGFCVDIGAPKSVVHSKELNKSFERMGSRRPTLRISTNRFRFADANFDSLGTVKILLAAPYGQKPIWVQIDVLMANIPPLHGMDGMESQSLILETYQEG